MLGPCGAFCFWSEMPAKNHSKGYDYCKTCKTGERWSDVQRVKNTRRKKRVK